MGIINDAEGSFYFYKGVGYRNANEYASAMHFFNLAIEKYQLALASTPNNHHILRNIALSLTQLIEIQKACCNQQEKEGLFLSPNDPQVQEAIRYYNRAIEADPKDPFTLFSYAQLLWKCDLLEKAEKLFLKSLEVAPNYMDALESYGRFLVEARNNEELGLQFYLRASLLRKQTAPLVAIVPSGSPTQSQCLQLSQHDLLKQ
jgi:tetratricopeptide (TPR) repeat protein